MSTTSAADSVYFSFLYQPKGLGDLPEPSDSLVLEFYAKDLDQWNRIWSAQGEVFDGFKQGHIAIKNSDYFKKGFQFRFKNYGGLSGSLDHFHLDYVNLRKFSGQQAICKSTTRPFPTSSRQSAPPFSSGRTQNQNVESSLRVFQSGLSEPPPKSTT